MPLYEFECEACKTRFERIQKFTDANPEACPTCGKGPVRKLPSSPAIQFKGSGFYITDYAKKSSPEAGSGSKSGGGDKAASGEGKSGGDSKSGGDGKSGDSGSAPATSDSASKTTESSTKSADKKD
ncbi:MAG TPA: zinc ribbon domain-containing protein [Vicinamibacterales bacterium]